MDFMNNIFSEYKKGYNTQHVLRLIGDWKKKLVNRLFVGSINMDLSKALDCISYDLLIAKMNAYHFDKSALNLDIPIKKESGKV